MLISDLSTTPTPTPTPKAASPSASPTATTGAPTPSSKSTGVSAVAAPPMPRQLGVYEIRAEQKKWRAKAAPAGGWQSLEELAKWWAWRNWTDAVDARCSRLSYFLGYACGANYTHKLMLITAQQLRESLRRVGDANAMAF